jgi:hypothetical protein
MSLEVLQVSGGWLELAGQAAAIAGMGLLVLMFVAMGGYAYKQLRGGGVEWPEETADEGDGLTSGGDDDEWDYY